MASTYSPSLRIELIGAGEQAGTWNSTTNTNLGTLIESAIAGYVAVSVTSANQAFTASDGAADQARNAVIALSTTTSANFAVYAPPQEKTYIIYNTSAYTATIYNSTVLGNTTAAGTGIAVIAGSKVLVFSDGTNFYSTSAADLTGAVTSVGTVTSLGSFTSAQLLGALTDETGTGANVFAASPTFTGTPTLPTGTIATTQSFGNSSTALATTAFVQAALAALHPVGSIYINATNSTNPGTLLGFGTWTAFGAGRVPVGFDAGNALFDVAEETGGSADSTLPTHNHSASTSITDPGHVHSIIRTVNAPSSNKGISASADANVTETFTDVINSAVTGISASTSITSAGSSGTNANYQPYITVYMWKRTA
jgi:hypothetical protein